MVFSKNSGNEMDSTKEQQDYEITNVRYINRKESVEYICHTDRKKSREIQGSVSNGHAENDTTGSQSSEGDPETSTQQGHQTSKPCEGRKISIKVRFAEEVATKTVETRDWGSDEKDSVHPERKDPDKKLPTRKKATVTLPKMSTSHAPRKISAPAMIGSSVVSPVVPRRLAEVREETTTADNRKQGAGRKMQRHSDVKNPDLAQKLANLQHIGERTVRKFSHAEIPSPLRGLSPNRHVQGASPSSSGPGSPSGPRSKKDSFNVDFYYPSQEKISFIQKALAPPPSDAVRKSSTGSTGSTGSRKISRE